MSTWEERMSARAKERAIDNALKNDPPLYGPLPPYGTPGPPHGEDWCSICWGPNTIWMGNTWGVHHREDSSCQWWRHSLRTAEDEICPCHEGEIWLA